MLRLAWSSPRLTLTSPSLCRTVPFLTQSVGGPGSVRAIDESTGGVMDVRSSMTALSAKHAGGRSARPSESTPSEGGAYPSIPTTPSGRNTNGASGGGLFGAIANSLLESLATQQKVTFVVPKHELHENHDEPSRTSMMPQAEGEASGGAVGVGGVLPKLLNDHNLDHGEVDHHEDFDRWQRLTSECKRRLEMSGASADGWTGVLLKKPRGFTKVTLRRVAYQARFFTIDDHATHPLRYSHVSADIKKKFATIPVQSIVSITRHSEVELVLTAASSKTYKLRAPYNDPHAGETMQRCFDHMVIAIDKQRMHAPPKQLKNEEHEEAHEHPPWYKWPATTVGQVVYVLTFPIKAPVFLSTPNVLIKGNEKFYPLTIVMSMVWLAVFAILMTDIVEYMGCGLGIDTTVMGLSLGAIGTSFPNLYASILIAKQGAGDGAVCQAIAANTFNACICLGFLWLIHSIGLGSCDYGSHVSKHQGPCGGCYAPTGLKPLCPFWEGTNNAFGSAAGSTKGAILVTFVWAVIFMAAMLIFRARINRPVAFVFLALYLLYIVYQFVAAFVPHFALCIPAWNICI